MNTWLSRGGISECLANGKQIQKEVGETAIMLNNRSLCLGTQMPLWAPTCLSRVPLSTVLTLQLQCLDCSPPGAIHGILQARILQWVAIPFSRVSSQPRDLTQVSYIAHFS